MKFRIAICNLYLLHKIYNILVPYEKRLLQIGSSTLFTDLHQEMSDSCPRDARLVSWAQNNMSWVRVCGRGRDARRSVAFLLPLSPRRDKFSYYILPPSSIYRYLPITVTVPNI